MWTNDYERLVTEAEGLSEPASGTWLNAWLSGVGVALVLAVYGAWCIWSQSAYFIGDKPLRIVMYNGDSAVALGVVQVCIGFFVHFHFFWSWRRRYHGYAQIGKVLATLGIAGGVWYFVFSVLVLE